MFLAANHEKTAASWLAYTGWLSLITLANLIHCPPTLGSLLDSLMKLVTRFSVVLQRPEPRRCSYQIWCGPKENSPFAQSVSEINRITIILILFILILIIVITCKSS